MAIQDGRLTVGENLVLQFLADLLAISPRAFSRLFQQIARRPFPVAGDPSDPSWWKRREAGLEAEEPPDSWGVPRTSRDSIEPPAAPPAMTREEALSVLGLEEPIVAASVHAAYRKLAKKRHPDRFAPLGQAAVASATFMFERLQQAQQVVLAG
jgi:DnaJ-domain-containing protein 1